MQLSIIVPAHNEERRLAKMLDAYLPFFARAYGTDFEIVIVVNNSTDQTEAVVKKYAQIHPQVKCVVDPRPIGKGGAVMLGFRNADGELLGFVDADGSTPPEAFQDLVLNIGGADAIIASRWMKGALVSPYQPLSRRAASRLFNGTVRVLFGLKISDTQCGAKLIKREAVMKILPLLGITRWAFDVDLLFQLRRTGCRITEVPTTWRDVAGSRLQIARASLEMFVALVRLRLLYSPFKGIVSFYDRHFAKYFNV
jgi:glycosyltransferase involved in cell wall biosynthesis